MKTLLIASLLLACSAEAKLPSNCKTTFNGTICPKPTGKRGMISACRTWIPIFGGLIGTTNDTYLHFRIVFLDVDSQKTTGNVEVRIALDGSAVLGPNNETLEAPVSAALHSVTLKDASGFQTAIDDWKTRGKLSVYYPD
jgi:hypothetical protein